MPAVETTSYGVGPPSASSSSSSIPPEWVADALEPERIPALRESIGGMESQLVDLALDSASPGLFMDWLRMPLRCATDLGDLAALKRLLAAGVETELPPERLRPAAFLHLAVESGREGVVQEVLKARVDLHETDSDGENGSALHGATATGSEAAVRALVGAGASIDAVDASGWTPFQ